MNWFTISQEQCEKGDSKWMQTKFLTNGRKEGKKGRILWSSPTKGKQETELTLFVGCLSKLFDSIRLQLALESFFESQANDFCGLFFGHIFFCPFCARLPSLSFAFSSLRVCAFVPGDLGCAEFVYGLELLWPHCDWTSWKMAATVSALWKQMANSPHKDEGEASCSKAARQPGTEAARQHGTATCLPKCRYQVWWGRARARLGAALNYGDSCLSVWRHKF